MWVLPITIHIAADCYVNWNRKSACTSLKSSIYLLYEKNIRKSEEGSVCV